MVPHAQNQIQKKCNPKIVPIKENYMSPKVNEAKVVATQKTSDVKFS